MTFRASLMFAATLVSACADAPSIASGEQPSTTRGAECVLPWGANWNDALGVDSRIVVPSCPEILVGERFIPLTVGITNEEGGGTTRRGCWPA